VARLWGGLGRLTVEGAVGCGCGRRDESVTEGWWWKLQNCILATPQTLRSHILDYRNPNCKPQDHKPADQKLPDHHTTPHLDLDPVLPALHRLSQIPQERRQITPTFDVIIGWGWGWGWGLCFGVVFWGWVGCRVIGCCCWGWGWGLGLESCVVVGFRVWG